MSYLTLNGVRKEFGSAVAVEGFDLAVEPGEFVSFLGPSGCGKTTTLRMIAGFEQPTSGVITLAGEDITTARPSKRDVGMVFQSYALFPNMTVAQNVGFGLKVKDVDKSEIASRVEELLDLIHLPDKGTAYPHELSGGQQQRVALARALAIRPKVLLLDEPLSALDAKIRDELRYEIRRIQQQMNITTIYVTHDQEEAMALSDRVVVMSRGVIEQVDEPFKIYNYPATSFVAAFVGKLNSIECVVEDPPSGRVRCGDATIRTNDTIPQPAGSSVTLMLRPEELNVRGEEENKIPGTIAAVSFLGAIVRVQVDVGTTTLTVDVFNERLLQMPRVGDRVQVSFPPHACWVMG
jgi:putative spermidine/putrescine transport system ATP-binding protein